MENEKLNRLRWRHRTEYIHFATEALRIPTWLQNFVLTDESTTAKNFARMAFDYADAMLVEMNARMERRGEGGGKPHETPPHGTPMRRAGDPKPFPAPPRGLPHG